MSSRTLAHSSWKFVDPLVGHEHVYPDGLLVDGVSSDPDLPTDLHALGSRDDARDSRCASTVVARTLPRESDSDRNVAVDLGLEHGLVSLEDSVTQRVESAK
jgi:hypothetical protein